MQNSNSMISWSLFNVINDEVEILNRLLTNKY